MSSSFVRYFPVYGLSVLFAMLLALPVIAQDLNKELLAAARAGRLAQVEALLMEGADVNAANENGKTALMAAAYYNNERVVRRLLSEGADVNRKDNRGVSALMEAVINHQPNLVQIFIEYGADINNQASNGHTPLYEAILDHNMELMELLVLRGADLELKIRKDQTAYDLVKARVTTLVDLSKEVDEGDLEGDALNYYRMMTLLKTAGAVDKEEAAKKEAEKQAAAEAEKGKDGKDKKKK